MTVSFLNTYEYVCVTKICSLALNLKKGFLLMLISQSSPSVKAFPLPVKSTYSVPAFTDAEPTYNIAIIDSLLIVYSSNDFFTTI